MHRRMVRQAALGAALASMFALPTAAQAAIAKPAVTTGGAAQITFSGARLTGTVDPNGAATTYVFRYGPASNYYNNETLTGRLSGDGRRTVTADISGLAPATSQKMGPRPGRVPGAARRPVPADISGLAPATVYHYRLIASNSAGKTQGGDRTFKTKNQPLGVTFTGTPNPVPTGASSTLSG